MCDAEHQSSETPSVPKLLQVQVKLPFLENWPISFNKRIRKPIV